MPPVDSDAELAATGLRVVGGGLDFLRELEDIATRRCCVGMRRNQPLSSSLATPAVLAEIDFSTKASSSERRLSKSTQYYVENK